MSTRNANNSGQGFVMLMVLLGIGWMKWRQAEEKVAVQTLPKVSAPDIQRLMHPHPAVSPQELQAILGRLPRKDQNGGLLPQGFHFQDPNSKPDAIPGLSSPPPTAPERVN